MILYELNKRYLNESIGETIVFAGLLALISAILAKIEHSKLLQKINSCYKNDYLVVELEGKNITTPGKLEQLFMVRKKEISRILKNKGVVLVFDKEAYNVLRGAFQDIDFFKILSTGKSVTYDIDEFVKKYSEYFKTFGEYRKEVNIESVTNLFKRIDTKSLKECARINLWWIGVILRQIILHGKEYGIEKITFKAREVKSITVED